MISVVICTYKRSRSLRRALQSLTGMEFPAELAWEVIVVDNNSADDTRFVVEEFGRTSRLNVRYIFEKRQGKSRALNKGIEEARGEIIAFTDDDMLVGPDWLAVIQKEFLEDPSLGFVGGRTELLDPGGTRITVRLGQHRVEADSLEDGYSLVAGGNLAARRTALESAGLFDPEFGPGGRWGCGEDRDLLYRGWKAGIKIVYDPAVFAIHDNTRRTRESQRRTAAIYTVGSGAVFAKIVLGGDMLALKHIYWETLSALRNRGFSVGVWHFARLFRGFAGYAAAHWPLILALVRKQCNKRFQARRRTTSRPDGI